MYLVLVKDIQSVVYAGIPGSVRAKYVIIFPRLGFKFRGEKLQAISTLIEPEGEKHRKESKITGNWRLSCQTQNGRGEYTPMPQTKHTRRKRKE